MSAILNTFNKEAVCEGKMRVTHYNIERQKPRENNLDVFFLAQSETPRYCKYQIAWLNGILNSLRLRTIRRKLIPVRYYFSC